MHKKRPKEKIDIDNLLQKEQFIQNLYKNVIMLTRQCN
jgi:hypothetical protein